MTKAKKPRKAKYTLKTADKHLLYEKAVQNADYDAQFMYKHFKKVTGRKPVSIKEDFCGTAAFAAEWVKLKKDTIAIGVDFDQPTLDWGIERNIAPLKDHQRERLTLLCDNVLNVQDPLVDIVVGFNFSYCIFKTRAELLAYYKNAYNSLKNGGMFSVDIFGGSESTQELEESTKKSGFTYSWEHAKFNPITNEILCHIHFDFSDGTRMKKAFTYDWRLWSIPEIRELMEEAGFRETYVLWEGTDPKTESGNGVFKKTETGEACESYIAYVCGLK